MSAPLTEEHLNRARSLMEKSFLADGHTDTFNSPNFNPEGFFAGGTKLQADLPSLRAGCFDLQITALYIPPQLPDREGAGRSLSYLGRILTACRRIEEVRLVLEKSDLDKISSSGPNGLLVDLEGADALCGDSGLLEVFFAAGVRSLGLTHNANNAAGGGCRPAEGVGGALTDFGRGLVRRCEELGVALDAAHLGRASFKDLMDIATRPVINSHACCAAICEMDRNVTDEGLKAIAATGGLTAITYVPYFLVPDDAPDTPADSALVFRHIEHAAEVCGIEHVGLGSDFDGTDRLPDDVNSPAEVVNVVARMVQAGWPDGDIEKVLGQNFRRVLAELLP